MKKIKRILYKVQIKKHSCFIITALFLLMAAIYMLGLAKNRLSDPEELSVDGMLPLNVYHEVEEKVVITNSNFAAFLITFYTDAEGSQDVAYVTLEDSQTDAVYGTWKYDFSNLEADQETDILFQLNKPIQDEIGSSCNIIVDTVSGESAQHASICVTTQDSSSLQGFYVSGTARDSYNMACKLLAQKVGLLQVTIFFLVLLLILLGIRRIKKVIDEDKAIEQMALFFLILFGLLYFVVVPMLQVPDELGHYYRSYEISEGTFITKQSDDGSGYSLLPSGIVPDGFSDLDAVSYQTIKDAFVDKIDTQNLIRYANPTQALYSPISYLPQAIGCLMGRVLSNRAVIIFYFGRLFNFMICGVLTYYAIKKLPFGKNFFLLMSCMPMYFQQMVSLSSDAFINACAFLLIACVLAARRTKEFFKTRDKVILFSVALLVALCKVVYLPLCFLCWLIPGDRFQDKRRSYWYKILLSISSMILNIGWLLIGFRYMIEFREGVDSAAQIQFIFSHPFSYMLVILQTIGLKGINWLGTMTGAKLCRLNVYTCLVFVVIYLIFLLFEMLFVHDSRKIQQDKGLRMTTLILFIMILGLTLTGLYIQWTAVQNASVEGFQGRYLIPIMPLLMLTFPKKRIATWKHEIMQWEFSFIAVINVCALFSIYTYYL